MELIRYGYIKPDGNPIPLEYLAQVTSLRNEATVVSPLQEALELEVNSRWVPLVNTSMLSSGNILVQLATGGRRSLITKATSRRIWLGSSPMKFSLKMCFEAVEDPNTEVFMPLLKLSQMALPSQTSKEIKANQPDGAIGESLKTAAKVVETGINVATTGVTAGGLIPLLCPPGPSPFTSSEVLNLRAASSMLPNVKLQSGASVFDELLNGDKIMVEIGNFITFFNVIITEVRSSVPIKFDKLGNPVSAKVNVHFETYEMMTTEDLANVFEKHRNVAEIAGSWYQAV